MNTLKYWLIALKPLWMLLWVAGMVAPFFVLKFYHAVALVLFVSAVAPIIAMLLFAPLKRILWQTGPFWYNVACGTMEVATALLALVVLNLYVDIQNHAIIALYTLMYVSNQINRVTRSFVCVEEDELWELVGFLLTGTVLGCIYLFFV